MNINFSRLSRTWKYSLEELKEQCKKNGITNSLEYRNSYHLHEGFPSHPENVYSNEWISYNDFFGIQDFIAYTELKKLLEDKSLSSQVEYKKFVRASEDVTLPLDPQKVYEDEWENWYVFLNKEEPFRTEYIKSNFVEWKLKINEFMKIALGGETKISHLCRFVRLFIERVDLSTSPAQLLTKEKVDVKSFKAIVDGLRVPNLQGKMLKSVNEFLDYILINDLTIEDEETGEIHRVLNARNPFSNLPTYQQISTSPNESTKPHLQYHYVKEIQDWLIPKSAKCLRDLVHLQSFDADWVEVDKSLIDKDDINCVYKKIKNQYYLWKPIDWIHLFALTKIPLRGVQIAYNDSGEGDELIADIDSAGRIIWTKNESTFSGMTKNQSFIMKMPEEGCIGTFITTNKTKSDGKPYSIPWMPEDLAYWLVILRKWQQKYNPIHAPTRWVDCIRTNFNETQLLSKGINCFLFRAFNELEARNVSAALTDRLAAAIYHIQPKDLVLATNEKKNLRLLSNFSSKYTPHSMRVSLITAYIMEMGMPIEIVMKIVGHSSVVMTIYYCKINSENIRQKLEEGEKRALQNQAFATQHIIEQNKIEEVKNDLVANNDELLNALTNEIPAGNFVFRDFGICPFAAARCEDGGELIGSSSVRAPVQSGYLGKQNCLRCRHFVTGPAYLGGLLSISNEILLQTNIQSVQCSDLQSKSDEISTALDILDREEYLAELEQREVDPSNRRRLESNKRRLESDYENSAMKLDVFLCDLQASYRLIKLCSKIVNNSHKNEQAGFSLIKMQDSELLVELEESSQFQQLQEVCENATIYQASSAHNAILPRTQILDRMAVLNNIPAQLFLLSSDDQFKVGNEMFKLLKSRLKSWSRINKVINGEVFLRDLEGDEKILPSEIKFLTTIKNAPENLT